MKKLQKGFTLIELMIVVAIIGILAAIAIPNFLRYQLRTKAAERKLNVQAIYTSEEAGRVKEGGLYRVLAATPAANPTAVKTVWVAADYQAANAIDWITQGGTFGQYSAAIDAGGTGLAVTIMGRTDIDGDGVFAGECIWAPQISAAGAVATAPVAFNLAGVAAGAAATGGHVLGFAFATDSPGQPYQISNDGTY